MILFKGDRTQRPATYDMLTKCELLDYENPYMRLGPFFLEHLNKKGNYVGRIHQIVTEAEMREVKRKTKGQMKATPYEDNPFSYKRTSKIKYIR